MGTVNGEPNTCKDEDEVDQVVAKMKVTKMTDDKVQKMIARVQEVGDTMTSDQLRTIIAEIQEGGGEGRGDMYKDEGAGRQGESEAEGAGRGGAYEGEGRQDRHYYLLAYPRLAEAHDFSTVVPHTGSARSSPKPLTVDNLPYSKHLRGDTYEGQGAGHCRGIKAEDAGRNVMYKDGGAGCRRRNKAKEEWPGTCERARRGTSCIHQTSPIPKE